MSAGIEYATGTSSSRSMATYRTDPTDIPAMLAKIDEGYDLVHGWRKDRQDPFLSRRLPSLIANRLISKTTRSRSTTRLHAQAMRRDIASDLRLYGEMHRFIRSSPIGTARSASKWSLRIIRVFKANLSTASCAPSPCCST